MPMSTIRESGEASPSTNATHLLVKSLPTHKSEITVQTDFYNSQNFILLAEIPADKPFKNEAFAFG